MIKNKYFLLMFFCHIFLPRLTEQGCNTFRVSWDLPCSEEVFGREMRQRLWGKAGSFILVDSLFLPGRSWQQWTPSYFVGCLYLLLGRKPMWCWFIMTSFSAFFMSYFKGCDFFMVPLLPNLMISLEQRYTNTREEYLNHGWHSLHVCWINAWQNQNKKSFFLWEWVPLWDF